MSRKNFFGQSPFFQRTFMLVFAMFLVLGTMAFVGCDTDGEDEPDSGDTLNPVLVGTWEDPTYSDTYTINGTTIGTSTIVYSGGGGGTIVYVSNFSNDSGVIIFQFSPAAANGRTFGAVYYRELKTSGEKTSANMSTAGLWVDSGEDNDGDGYNDYVDGTPAINTLDLAKAQYTLDNGDGHYVTFWGGPYVKK
jgi:hypothetical protein